MSAFTPPYPPFHTLAQMFTLLPPSLYGLTLTIPSPTLMRNRSFSHTHTHTRHHTLHIFTPTQVLIVTRSHTRSLSLHVFMPALIHTPTCLHAYPHTLLTTYTHSVRPTTRSHKFTFTNGYSHFLTCTLTTSLTHMHSFALTRSFSLTHTSAHTPPHPSQTLMLSLSLLHSS